jgi:Carboxypeptidase regulatory-like domain
MRRVMSFVVAGLVCGSAVAAQMTMQQSPARDSMAMPTGPAEIGGTLMTEGDTPQPVRRAEVRLIGAGGPPRTTFTDASGRFVFRALPLGRYTLEANKPGFVRSAYGARRYDRPGTPVTVTTTERSHDLQWRMPRGAVITGRVLDEFGQPAQGARINIQQVRVVNGERTLTSVPMVTTIFGEVADDRGVYRLYGLPAGDYVVSATPRSIGTGDIRRLTDAEIQAARQAVQQPTSPLTPTPASTTLGFSQVYFPGVLTSNEATAITVAAGEERGGVDFVAPLVRTATLAGTVITPGNVPPEAVQLFLSPKTGGSSVNAGAGNTMVFTTIAVGAGNRRVNADGTFTYGGVSPGAYTLSARAQRDGGASLWAAVDVVVDGQNIEGLSLSLQEGLSLSGKLAFEGDGVDPPDTFTRARINFLPISGAPVINPPSTTVTDGGVFTARGLFPGLHRLIASFNTPEVNWILKSAMIKGRDALDLPFDLAASDTITDAVLTFTNKVQTLNGTLSDASQRPAPDYTIVVFPEDKALWSSSRRVRTARPGTDGKFTVAGLPSGTYRIAAVTDIGPEETRDLALLEELAGASIVFTLADGETKTQDIRIK